MPASVPSKALRCHAQIHGLRHGDDAGVSHTLPRQTQHQGVELGSLQLPMGIQGRGPSELALVQAASGQPDTNAVVHQFTVTRVP